MDLADLVDLLGVEEDPLGDGRLAGVDMGNDPDVPRLRERNLACHGSCFLLSSGLAYHLKWLKALLASAILCVSSRRLTAAPTPFIASTSSAASFSDIRLAAALAGGLDQPADAQPHAAIAADLDRHLVRGATDAARLDLDDRGRVAQRSVEHLEAGPARGSLSAGQRLAQDALGQALLAVHHQLDDETVRGARHRSARTWPCAGSGLVGACVVLPSLTWASSRRTASGPACGRARRRRRACRG